MMQSPNQPTEQQEHVSSKGKLQELVKWDTSDLNDEISFTSVTPSPIVMIMCILPKEPQEPIPLEQNHKNPQCISMPKSLHSLPT